MLLNKWSGPFFEADGGTSGTVETSEAEEKLEEEEKAANTEEEGKKQALTQRDIDEIVERRLARERKKWEDEAKQAARLATLSEAERQTEELKLANAKVAELESEKTRILLMQDTVTLLAESGIPAEYVKGFAEFLVGEDAETTMIRVKTFDKAFKAAVKTDRIEQMKDGAPKGGSWGAESGGNPFAKETFDETAQIKLFKDSPEQARALAKAAGIKIN